MQKRRKQWGEILATSHARADNDQNKGRITYSFEKNDKFIDLVYEIASEYANQVEKDFKYFTDWFDASKCPKP